jgi:hypothetical protein
VNHSFLQNSPLIGWAAHLISKRSMVAKHLVQALALHLKIQRAFPLTPMHIKGKRNPIPDIPSHLFGSNTSWKCNTDSELLTLFNSMFHLSNQQSWTVFYQKCNLIMHVTLALQMKPLKLDDWRRLPKVGRHIGNIGAPMSNLGSGSVPSAHTVPNKSPMSHRACSMNKIGILRTRTTSPK